jgi:hypothetical protein
MIPISQLTREERGYLKHSYAVAEVLTTVERKPVILRGNVLDITDKLIEIGSSPGLWAGAHEAVTEVKFFEDKSDAENGGVPFARYDVNSARKVIEEIREGERSYITTERPVVDSEKIRLIREAGRITFQ